MCSAVRRRMFEKGTTWSPARAERRHRRRGRRRGLHHGGRNGARRRGVAVSRRGRWRPRHGGGGGRRTVTCVDDLEHVLAGDAATDAGAGHLRRADARCPPGACGPPGKAPATSAATPSVGRAELARRPSPEHRRRCGGCGAGGGRCERGRGGGGGAGAGAGAGGGGGGGAAAAGGGAGAAARAPVPPRPHSSPITASRTPTSTVSPSGTRISVRTPAAGEGTSESTLSVDTSKSGSSRATVSPTAFIHRVTVPSVTVSPNCGIVTSANVQSPSGQRQHRLAE